MFFLSFFLFCLSDLILFNSFRLYCSFLILFNCIINELTFHVLLFICIIFMRKDPHSSFEELYKSPNKAKQKKNM